MRPTRHNANKYLYSTSRKGKCLTCLKSKVLIKYHQVGISMCEPCTKQVNEMIHNHGVRLETIAHASAEEKRRWVNLIEEMGLYIPMPPQDKQP